jgi:transcriptional regulator with XRE-family HTH domain
LINAAFSPEAAKALRLKLGLTQQQIAELAGYAGAACRQNWSMIESGVRGMDSARWELLLLKAGVHPTLELKQRHPL